MEERMENEGNGSKGVSSPSGKDSWLTDLLL